MQILARAKQRTRGFGQMDIYACDVNSTSVHTHPGISSLQRRPAQKPSEPT